MGIGWDQGSRQACYVRKLLCATEKPHAKLHNLQIYICYRSHQLVCATILLARVGVGTDHIVAGSNCSGRPAPSPCNLVHRSVVVWFSSPTNINNDLVDDSEIVRNFLRGSQRSRAFLVRRILA